MELAGLLKLSEHDSQLIWNEEFDIENIFDSLIEHTEYILKLRKIAYYSLINHIYYLSEYFKYKMKDYNGCLPGFSHEFYIVIFIENGVYFIGIEQNTFYWQKYMIIAIAFLLAQLSNKSSYEFLSTMYNFIESEVLYV